MAQTQGIHAHNDYKQKVPFWNSYAHGAKSIEVDIVLENSQLFVAHERETIHSEKTIETLYLAPINQIFENKIIEPRPFQLLIDIKSEAKSTLKILLQKLKPLQKHLYPYNPKGVKIVISGNRPNSKEFKNYPKHIYFDYQNVNLPSDLSKVAMLSLDFKKFSQWNGKGRLIEKEENNIKEAIKIAKNNKLPIRFWANPDTKTAWFTFIELGVDFIGTDYPAKAEAYIKNLNKSIEYPKCNKNNYSPKHKVDNIQKPVKNVILLIGDGMGLAHVSSASLICTDMIMNKFKQIGFSKTSSANDYTTDSAAGGTAIAIGEKTKNRSIGVDKNGNEKPNLTEIVSVKGLSTGIVTTDEIFEATPASFYGHAEDRGMRKKISDDLIKSNIKFFSAGGEKFFTENGLKKELEKKGFNLIKNLSEINQKMDRIAFFASKHSLPYIKDGRGDQLPKATEAAINYLKEKPFFLMVESAQIDNFGHFNEIKGVIEETLDFDMAIQKAVEFADQDGETLVIVTADHETGGLTIPHGNLKRKMVEGSFSTYDHTGIMVPVFAYGPQSSEFQGVYENHEIFYKILKVLNIKP